MGKDLKGKELGVGISQRSDGLYTARFTDRYGNRKQRYFHKLQECRKWLADAQFDEEHGNINAFSEMTVEAWFDYWINEIKGKNIRLSTVSVYRNRFNKHMKFYIGNMKLCEVKPLHCQNILNNMASNCTNSTINEIKTTMHNMFESAVDNEIIVKNPVTKAVKCNNGKKSKPERVLTLEEQRMFLDTARKRYYYNQFAFILQTGLRVGEITGLKWEDIDFNKKVIHIKRSMGYRSDMKGWLIGEPKTRSGYRDVPLTAEAIQILKNQKDKINAMPVIPIEYSDFVFLNKRGKPIMTRDYDRVLSVLCERIRIKEFSMHTLRHTFATRCIEAGMKPKTLQMILGHSNINLTMNLYVHVTEEEKVRELENVEKSLMVV